MSLGTDREFVNRISRQVRNFKWVTRDLANFSCPICGDSRKNKTKARGYVYRKGTDMFYRCHNCGQSTTLGNFLQKIAPAVYEEYRLQRYINGEGGHSNFKIPNFGYFRPNKAPQPDVVDKKHLIRPTLETSLSLASELPDNHSAVIYLRENRMLPAEAFKHVHVIERTCDYAKVVDEERYGKAFASHEEPRIAFCSRTRQGDMVGISARDYLGATEQRYIILKLPEMKDVPMIFGLERVDFGKPIYVTEGAFDSLFLPNALAVSGSDLSRVMELPWFDRNRTTFVFDNEPRNKAIVKQYENLLKLGARIFFWPCGFKWKDINEVVQAGVPIEAIRRTIDVNTKEGLEGHLALATWRKAA